MTTLNVCVGAVSQLAVEVAAALEVPQIVASRRQVDTGGGYIGLDQQALVNIVKSCSSGRTQVIRDHGGPMQGGKDDDGVQSFEDDLAAGFDGLHIDVCMLPRSDQLAVLSRLLRKFGGRTQIEVGGEHDEQQWLEQIINTTMITCNVMPNYAVVDTGAFVWEDKQSGNVRPVEEIAEIIKGYAAAGIKTKAHNMDWLGRRRRITELLGLYNIAPEVGRAETDAWLHVFTTKEADYALSYAYQTYAWQRWFDLDQGTWDDRARCALRYVMLDPPIREIVLEHSGHELAYVRGRIADVILAH